LTTKLFHAWRWFDPTDPGWPERHWIGESLTIGDTSWYARIDPEGAPGLPPLVMVHGLVVSGSYFRPVATYLDDEFRLYIPDLPGFGRSRTSRAWTLIQHADGLADWMKFHDLRDAVLVANSLGCQVLTLLAIRHPDLVRAMVLVAPTMDPQGASVLKLAIRGARDIPRERQSLWKIWLPDFLRAGPVRATRALRDGLRDPQEIRLPKITQPVIVVGGECDPIVSAAWVRDMATRIPKGEAVILPGAPHAMNYSDPRALAGVIRAVVRDQAR
jgi:pimeloyl-ACP methyl ester carboxylesterase